MSRKIRNALITAGITLGLIAATATPASAGLMLANHTEPLTQRFGRAP
jgi:hypothetical protein